MCHWEERNLNTFDLDSCISLNTTQIHVKFYSIMPFITANHFFN